MPTAFAAKETPTGPTWPWVVGGLGLVSLGVAVGFGVDGLAATDALINHCGPDYATQPCRESVGTYDPTGDNSRKNLDLGMFIGLASVGVAAVTAAVIGRVTIAPSRQTTRTTAPPARVTLAPQFTASSAGLSLRGEF